ncbi:MAG: DUF2298 domain-containing protein [Candidatus Norongarragalinales archaeon]
MRLSLNKIFFFKHENLAVFAAALASLAFALFFQPLAFAVVRAFAFLVPGLLLLAALRLELPLAAQLPALMFGSVLVSTQAVYWTSLALGYSRFSVFAAFAALSLFVFLVPSGDLRRFFKNETWLTVFCEAKRDALAFAASAVVFILVFTALSTLWVLASDASLDVTVGGWNYGDFFYHMGIMQSVNEGNFPPQEPSFAGAPIHYHWFSDFHTAIISKTTLAHPAVLARFETALYDALLVLCVYSLALAFFELKEWGKRAALLAAVLLVFCGSFAFLKIIPDVESAPLDVLLKQSAYDNDWRFFQVPSMLTGFLLVQRPLVVGLPVFALILFFVVSSHGDKRKLFLAGLLCGFAAPFQFYAFAAAVLAATLWFALRFAREKNKSMICCAYAFFFIPCAVLAAPFAFTALSRAGRAGLVRLAPFWLAPSPFSDALGFAWFYAANLGAVFVLSLAALAFFAAKPKQCFDGAAFLALLALAFFTIPNLVSLSGTQWDMCKFFAFLWLPCAILAAAFLASLAASLPRWATVAALAVAVFACIPGFFGLYWYGASDWRGLSGDEVAAGEWVRANTPQRSVFLAAPVHNSAVESVGGRLRVTGYQALVSNYGLPYREREADLRAAFCGSAEEAKRVAEKYGARFVWLGSSERSTYKSCSFAFSSSTLFSRVYGSRDVEIYELREQH